VVKADTIHKELNFCCCFPCRSLPGGCITQITGGLEFLPSSLSGVCRTRELLEEAGLAVPPHGFVALSGFVSLKVKQPFL